MTKELELFKRWFGIDPSSLDIGFEEFEKIYINHLSGELIDPTISIFIGGGLWEDIKPLFELPGIFEICGSYGCNFYISYSIPPQYHAEWEQYVKEMKE